MHLLSKLVLVLLIAGVLSSCTQSERAFFASTERINVALSSLEPQKFVPGIEDLPLYQGFRPKGGENAVYASGKDRLVELTYYSHIASKDSVEEFYSIALAQLGWVHVGDHRYERMGEQLILEVFSRDGATNLYIYLTPAYTSNSDEKAPQF